MKTTLKLLGCATTALVLALPYSVHAQSVYLRVQPVASSTGLKKHGQPADGEEARSFARTATLKVTVTNMQPKPGEFAVEWQFLAKGVADKNTRVYDAGTKTVPLKGAESTSFDVQSKPLQATDTRSYEYDDDGNLTPTGARQQTGDKPVGYVVLVKANDILIAVEASDEELKKSYQDQINKNRLKPKP